MKKFFRVATRGSALALRQTQLVVDFLSKKIEGAAFEVLTIKTSGDKRQDWSLEAKGGKGLFTKEIEEALVSKEADIAVHSAKDLPTENPEGLQIVGCLPRDDSRDVMVLRSGVSVPTLIATGAPRRRAQLKFMFPQAVWGEIRGNVDTRLKKLAAGAADATVLSAAGLSRLGIADWDKLVFKPLKINLSVPAVGQGIIAVQARHEDAMQLSPLFDAPSNLALSLERAFLTALGGGCQTAYAAHFDGAVLHIFHENCGYQKLTFADAKDIFTMKARIAEVAAGLK